MRSQASKASMEGETVTSELIAEYDRLVPADQTIIDCMILTLVNKDKQINSLCKEVQKELDRKIAIAAIAQT